MNQRTKILAFLFGGVLVVIVGAQVVYPTWIEPLVSIDDRIAAKQREYDKLAEFQEEVQKAKYAYREFVARLGSFDVGDVEIDVRARLNELIEKHKLQGANVSRGRTSEDRKTGLSRLQVTVGGTCTLQSAIEFIKDVAEMPQLVRVGSVSVSPAARSTPRGRGKARGKKQELMNLRIPVEVLVLPQQKVVGRLDPKELAPRENVPPRHMNNAYARIWEARPFSEYVPPVPLRASAGRTVTVLQGAKAALAGSATGGDGEYTYLWEPSTRLSDASSPKPDIDTKETFTEEYTLTVTDGEDQTATATVRVAVNEPPPPPPPDKIVERPPPGPVEPPKDQPWKDGRYMQIRQALLNWSEGEPVGELMVFNSKGKKADYYTVGAEFDGGELLYVHPTGAVARRNDDFFLYPIGGRLDEAFKPDVETALEYPALKSVADRLQEAAVEEAAKAKAEEEAKAAQRAEAAKKAAPTNAAAVKGAAGKPAAPKTEVTQKGGADDDAKPGPTARAKSGAPARSKASPNQAKKRRTRLPQPRGTRRVDQLRQRLKKQPARRPKP